MRAPRPSAVFTRPGSPGAIAAALILVVTLVAALGAWGFEHSRTRDEHEARADAATAALRFQLGSVVVSLQDLRALFESSGGAVDAQEFARYTELSILRQGSIISAWLPRVTNAERADFERRTGLPIREQTPGGTTHPAPTRAEYFPVELAEPSPLARPLLGLDVPLALPADDVVGRARDTGETQMSQPLPLTGPDGSTLILFEPVYANAGTIDTVAGRRAGFLGVVGGAYLLTSLSQTVLGGLPDGTELEIRDGANSIFSSGGSMDGAEESMLDIAGRTWTVRVAGGPGASVLLPATVLAGGLVLSALVWLLFHISARRQSEATGAAAALAAAAERHRAVVDTAADGIVTIDEQGTIEWVNGTVERLFGYPPADVVGQNITMLMPKALRARHTRGLERYLATGEAQILGTPGAEAVALRRDGTTFPVHLQVAEMHLGDERKFTGFIRDITERLAAEDRVQALNQELEHRVVERTEQLEAANRELEAFSYSVSHDLRSPLRTISGFSAVLIEDHAEQLDPEVQRLLGRIQAGAERMGALIDDLLGLARLGRAEMHRQRVDLSAAAERVAATLREREPARQVELRIEEDVSAYGDPRLLWAVLENLLGNAWKFTSKVPHPMVEFGSEQENGTRAFFVRDNGAGFDMAYADKLFGPFQRLHHADEFDGTGIGLATVQRIVLRHGGEVRAEGSVGHGAKITFTIPDAEDGQ